MRKKTQAEIWEKKLKTNNLYRILLVLFLVLTIVSSTFAIITAVNFNNYKKAMKPSRWISVVVQTRNMPDSDHAVPENYQLNEEDYGNKNGLVEGNWKGKTLDDFLRSLPMFFSFDQSGLMNGIKGSNDDPTLKGYWWALYSPTDPSVTNPDKPAPNGAPFMILQDVNVYYFALHKN